MNPRGEMEMQIILAPLVALDDGKKCANLFTFAFRLWPMIHRVNSSRISLSRTCFDRATWSALSNRLAQRRTAYYDEQLGPEQEESLVLAALRDWQTSVGCAGHDASGGLKWAVWPHSDTCVTKDLHVSIESLRNSFSHISSHVGEFL